MDDNSRVKLTELPDVLGSDYINASFNCKQLVIISSQSCLIALIFKGCHGNRYIAAQGKWYIVMICS